MSSRSMSGAEESSTASAVARTMPTHQAEAVEQAPRRPAGPSAGPSLAARIAALQNSSTGNTSRSSRSASAAASSISAARSPTSASAPRSVSHSINGAGSTDKTHENDVTPPPVTIKNSAAVKDRLARFQTPDKPLIPRSSFGSPAPMQKEAKVLRPYPGAAGGGSGQWGEGVLRPQMTGGAFQDGRQHAHEMRPQWTGSAWLGVGGSGGVSSPSTPGSATFAPGSFKGSASPNSLLLRSRSPVGQRDAFLELDDNSSSSSLSTSPQRVRPLRRDSSFSEAQMNAASAGLRRASRTASCDGTAESVGTSSVHTDHRDELDSIATTLPDGVAGMDAPKDKILIPRENGDGSGSSEIAPPDSNPGGHLDTTELQAGELSLGEADEAAPRPSNALLSQIRTRVANESIAEVPETASPQLGDGLALVPPDVSTDEGTAIHDHSFSAPSAEQREDESQLWEPASQDFTQLSLDDKPLPPIHSSQSFDSIASRQHAALQGTRMTPSSSMERFGARQTERDLPAITATMYSPGPYNGIKTSESSSSLQSASSQEAAQRAKAAISAARARHASNPPHIAAEGVQEGMPAASLASKSRAGEHGILVENRNGKHLVKSGSVRRPAPGRIMSPAEMDASDDEYEPGWASVTTIMSSSRIR